MNILGTADYKIIHGDAIEALENEISDNSIDLIFADPPYNIGKDFAGCKDKWASDDDGFMCAKTETYRSILCNDFNTVYAIF